MTHPSLLWIFNTLDILIVYYPFVDYNPYLSSKHGVSVWYAKTILYRRIETEQITHGDLLALKNSSILKTKTIYFCIFGTSGIF